MNKLRLTQQWVQAVITHPDGIQQGAAQAKIDKEQWAIESVVLPSKQLTSEQRIAIYHNSYFARLFECFKSDYKGLLNALGNELFEHLAWHFLQEHPSTTYTLNELGKNFPTYLQSTLTENLDGNAPDWWQTFIIDMAKYERLHTEVFNGEGHESILTDDLFGFGALRLSPSVKRLSLQFPIANCIGQFRENKTELFPKQATTHYIFSRDQYRVKVHAVEIDEWNSLAQWEKNPTEDGPVEYRDKWLAAGIVYS